jgi:uncharacterized membrane protein YgcG
MAFQINPETDSAGGNASDFCNPGRKLAHAVGLRRWQASTGTPMVTMGFVVLRDGAKKGDEGKVFMERFALTQAAIWRMARWAQASGHTATFDAESDDDLQRVMARGPVVAELEPRTYKGKEKLEVKEWAAYTGDHDPAWDGLISEGERAFAEIQDRLDQRAQGGGQSTGSSYGGGGGSSYGSGSPSAHDDIPF